MPSCKVNMNFVRLLVVIAQFGVVPALGSSAASVIFGNNNNAYNAPVYRFSSIDGFQDIFNASVVMFQRRFNCEPTSLELQSSSAVLFAIMPLCYPEALALLAIEKNFSAVIVGNGIAPAQGLWALSFWKSAPRKSIKLPVLDLRVNLKESYADVTSVTILLSDGARNYFEDLAHHGGFVFLLSVVHVINLFQFVLGIQRLRFNLRLDNKPKLVISMIFFKVVSSICLLVLLVDPFGIYGFFSFPVTASLCFFFLNSSGVSTFLLGFAFEKIVIDWRERVEGSKSKKSLLFSTACASASTLINLLLAALNSFTGSPDGFFLMLSLYGIVQVATVYYFQSHRVAVLKEQNKSRAVKTSDGFSRYFSNMTLLLLNLGILLNLCFLLVLQPVAGFVLAFGQCNSKSGNCSSLLIFFLVAIGFICMSNIVLLASIPGISREDWIKSHAHTIKTQPGSMPVILTLGDSKVQVNEVSKVDDTTSEVVRLPTLGESVTHEDQIRHSSSALPGGPSFEVVGTTKADT